MNTNEQKLQFLEAKRELLRPHLPALLVAILDQVFVGIRSQLDIIENETLICSDAELERFMVDHLLPDEAKEARKILMQRFGRTRLGEDAEKTLRRVLAKGKISNDSECAVVISRLGDQLHSSFGSADHARLGKILAEYETRVR